MNEDIACTMDMTRPVSEIVRHQIEQSGRSQKALAAEIGFPKPNMLTMIKQGKTRIPLARVPAIAEALNLDKRALMDACLTEYDPELLTALHDVYVPSINNDSERE